jgi:hypothetical protein
VTVAAGREERRRGDGVLAAYRGAFALPIRGGGLASTCERAATKCQHGVVAEERLEGGNVGGAVRVGDTVRRSAGPWTPAVHALLAHLAGTGFTGAPRPLGFDEQGREVLTFLEGESVDALDQAVAELASFPR